MQAKNHIRSKEWNSWDSMLQRCLYQKHQNYADYGGRGIDVCERWIFSFQYFLDDMGPRPTPEHTLDRIDPNGNYTPNNCRWATPKEQSRNKRNTLKLTFRGETKPLIDFGEEFNIPYTTLYARIEKGWSTEKALTTPLRKKRKNEPVLTAFGKTQHITEWAIEFNLEQTTIKQRLRRGLSPEAALTLPTDSRSRYIVFKERKQTLKEWTDELGIPYNPTLRRLNNGWSIEDSFTKPFRGRK